MITIAVTTNPFGEPNTKPRDILNSLGYRILYNEVGRKYSEKETLEVLIREKPEIIIAGTENYSKEVLDKSERVEMISRVGIGLDSIDLAECKRKQIIVTNTPDAPSNAVAEVTIGQMINMIRKINTKSLKWNRYIGKEIQSCTIGIIGVGRIGKLVLEKIAAFHPKTILLNDVLDKETDNNVGAIRTSKEYILKECDIVTIHIPLDDNNRNYISRKELRMMKHDACLLNFSRGGIINEKDLVDHLKSNKNFSVAVDTFVDEPYEGPLTSCENAYLTPHIGSCTEKSRLGMELGAVEHVISYLKHRNNI